MEQTWPLPLLDQARGISSGTLASLTGYCKYSEIDPIHAEFIEFCEENQNKYRNWILAWQAYAEIKQFPRKTD